MPNPPNKPKALTDFTVRFMGYKATIPALALFVMLGGILAPAAFYSVRLRDPTPTQLIVAVSIALFASVLFLWILDVTNTLRFRSKWVSRSVFTIGISEIITATVGIYKDAFTEHLHPFDGLWRLSAWTGEGQRIADNEELVLYFSKSANAYTGYSAFLTEPSPDSKAIRHIRIERFDPESKTLTATVVREVPQAFEAADGKVSKNATSFEFVSDTPSTVGSVRYVFTRP